MKSFYVGRQPVIGKGQKVAAYQILLNENREGSSDQGAFPTREVLRFLLRVGWRVISNGRSFIVPWDGQFPREEFPRLLPQGRVILAVRGDHANSGSLQELERYHATGFRLLLDDWQNRVCDHEIAPLCDFVRVDLKTNGRERFSELADSLSRVRASRIASGVQTSSDQAFCTGIGFPFSQGDWLVTPDPDASATPPNNHVILLRLLSILNDPDVPLDTVESLVRQDVGLSYRLVRLVNSAAYGLRHQVSSIGQAVMLLGLRHLRSWVSLSTVGLIGQKPRELMVQAMVRAFACEGLARGLERQDQDEMFTIGLFSVLDALLDRPMSDITAELPLTDEVKQVLLGEIENESRTILDCAIAHESGFFDCDALEQLALDQSSITGVYLDALVKTDHIIGSLEGS